MHLEFGPMAVPATEADVIIAAGDIGVYDQGLEWLKCFNKPVIYVAGNHEFYNHEYQNTLTTLEKESKGSNVHFLENEQVIIDDVRFIGCTMWTDLFLEGADKIPILEESLNDFRRIQYDNWFFDAMIFSQLHKRSKQWLARTLAKPFHGKTVVITHHAPTEWSWDNQPQAIKKLAYCNDLKHLMHKHDISAWFHGHTHSVSDYRIAGTRVLCNPRGYVGKRSVSNFTPEKVVEI